MGYDLHITRRKNWSLLGHDITPDEWLAYIGQDPELSLCSQNGQHMARWSGPSKLSDPWLDWFQGNIYTKNPDPALIDKMVQIARALNAQVQGDDGELYRNGHDAPTYPRSSLFARFRSWLRTLRPAPRLKPVQPSFQVGDRVVDAFGKESTVLHIAPASNNNLGKVTIRYDDGRELSFALVASGLRRSIPQKKDDAGNRR